MNITDMLMAKAMMGGNGGGGLFVVTVDTVDESSGGLISYSATADKTCEEIYNAWTSGLLPIVKLTGDAVTNGGYPPVLYLGYVVEDDGEYYAKFYGTAWNVSHEGDGVLIDVTADEVYYQGNDYVEFYCGNGTFPTE